MKFGGFRKLLSTEDKGGKGIKVGHWSNLSAGTDFLSLPKLLTEIWPIKPHFWAYFHFHGFSWGHLHTFFHFCIFCQNPRPENIHISLFYSFQKGGEHFWLSSKPSNRVLLGLFSWEIGKIGNLILNLNLTDFFFS